jgi:four helix bundle protein
MIAKTFQELIVWQKSKDLLLLIFPLSKSIKDFSFRDQLNRASLSISNNIAEGFGRNSKREFKRFLNISLGSAYEVKSMLMIFKELKLISTDEAEKSINQVSVVIRLLIGLIVKINVTK